MTATLLLALAASVTSGQAIYDSVSSETDGIAFVGDLVLDDLQVSGGGLLQSVTVSLTAGGPDPSQVTDVALMLAIDGGDGFPDIDGTGDDWVLFQALQPGVVLPSGTVTEVTIDVSQFWAVVPDDALLFGGVQLFNPLTGHVFHGDPGVGTTDAVVFSFANQGPVPAPGVADPQLTGSKSLSFRIDAAALPPESSGGGIAGTLLDFEALEEGFQGTQLTVGGVTFQEGRDGFPPPVDATFAVDDGTGVWDENPAMLDFVEGKLLQLNGFSGGEEGYTFPITKSMRLSVPESTGVRMTMAYVTGTQELDYSPGTLTLVALNGGEMVASDSIHPDRELGQSSGGSFTFGAGVLEITNVPFDELVLFSNGPSVFGGLLMGIDNVRIGTATCVGDVTNDGQVGVEDLVAVVLAWNSATPDADANGDGTVDVADLVEVILAWGPCP